MVSYCSSSNNQLLTKRLIEISNNPLKCFHQFYNKSEWINGLDVWSSSGIRRNIDLSQRYFDFHDDIGLYLPKNDKDSFENDYVYLKQQENKILPERIKKLIKKEKKLLMENDSNICLSEDQLSFIEDNQYTNSNEKPKSVEIPSNKVRLSLRQVRSKNSFGENQMKRIEKDNFQSLNQDKIKSLLKQQITSLFCRESTNINNRKTLVRIPLIEIKHKNYTTKTIPIIDSTLIMEKYDKLQRLLMSRSTNKTTNNNKFINNSQSPTDYKDISTFGLTITPVDCLSLSKNLENSSIETKLEQEYSSIKSLQLAEKASFRYSIDKNDEDEKNSSKLNLHCGFISSSGDFVISNKHSTDEQSQTIKKCYRHHRLSLKNRFERSKTSELLPSLVSGKRLHLPILNHKHS